MSFRASLRHKVFLLDPLYYFFGNVSFRGCAAGPGLVDGGRVHSAARVPSLVC